MGGRGCALSLKQYGFALALSLLLFLSSAQARESMRARCSACRAVGDALTQRLEAEVPRNHLDLRHRLDKDGKRYGKLIEYKMSELRVIHLLEDLCDAMAKYEFVEGKNESEGDRWARSDSLGSNRNFQVHLVKQQRKDLENYCHDLLERHEDTLSLALRNGEVGVDTASDFLCFTTARHCSEPLPPPATADGDDATGGAAHAATGDAAQGLEAGAAATDAAADVKRDEL